MCGVQIREWEIKVLPHTPRGSLRHPCFNGDPVYTAYPYCAEVLGESVRKTCLEDARVALCSGATAQLAFKDLEDCGYGVRLALGSGFRI